MTNADKIRGMTDAFADCLRAVRGGYEGGKTECRDYERRKVE